MGYQLSNSEFAKYIPTITKFARIYLDGVTWIEPTDVVQEVLLQLVRTRPQYVSKEILRLNVKSVIASARKKKHGILSSSAPLEWPDKAEERPVRVRQADLSDIVSAKELVGGSSKVELTELEKEILSLSTSGYSRSEIASILGIHRKTVGDKLHWIMLKITDPQKLPSRIHVYIAERKSFKMAMAMKKQYPEQFQNMLQECFTEKEAAVFSLLLDGYKRSEIQKRLGMSNKCVNNCAYRAITKFESLLWKKPCWFILFYIKKQRYKEPVLEALREKGLSSVQHLLTPYRRAIIAKRLEGKTFSQIARELGKTEKQVQSAAYKARRCLERYLSVASYPFHFRKRESFIALKELRDNNPRYYSELMKRFFGKNKHRMILEEYLNGSPHKEISWRCKVPLKTVASVLHRCSKVVEWLFKEGVIPPPKKSQGGTK